MKLSLCLMLISDALLAIAALCTAVALRFGSEVLRQEWIAGNAAIFLVFAAVTIFSSYLMELHSLARGSSKGEIFIKCMQSGCASFFFMSAGYFLHPNALLGQGVLFISIAIFCLYQAVWLLVSTSWKDQACFTKSVLILGTDKLAMELSGLISSCNLFVLTGFLGCAAEKEPSETQLAPWQDHAPGRMVALQGTLLATARKEKADIIVVALSERRGVLPLQEMIQCKLNGIEILDAATFYEILQGKLMLEHTTPNWIIFSSDLRRSTLVNLLKRCIDILLSLAGLILAAPLLPLVALAIKLDSPGPLFFKQIRVGDSEKTFLLYKFRTIAGEADMESGATISSADFRMTPVARFLRKTGIAEIPTLYNVLKGDMSLVGPRPERPEFVEMLKKDISYYSKRHTIKPGITGWAQVRRPDGSTLEDAAEKLLYDLYYIKNISAALDSQIMLETVKVALFGRGRR